MRLPKIINIVLFYFAVYLSGYMTSSAQSFDKDSLTLSYQYFLDREEYDKAINIIDSLSSTVIYEENINHFYKLRLDKIVALQKLGEHELALQEYKDQEENIENHIDDLDKEFLGLYFHKKGVSQYLVDDNVNSIKSYLRALAYRESILEKNDPSIIKTLSNLGNVSIDLNELGSAEEYFTESLSRNLTLSSPDSILLIRTYTNLSWILTIKSDFIKSKSYLDLAYYYAQSVHKEEPWEIGKILIEDQLQFYFATKDIEAMKSCLFQGLTIFYDIEEKLDEDYWSISEAYHNLGIAYELEDSLNRSIYYYNKSLQLNLEYGDQRLSKIADNHNNLSVVYEKMGHDDQAIKECLKSRKILQNLQDSFLIARTYHNTSLIYSRIGNYDKAMSDIDIAIQILEKRASFITGNISNYIEILSVKAELLIAARDTTKRIKSLKESLLIYAKIDKYLSTMRLEFDSDKSKVSLYSKARKIYNSAISVAYELYQLTGDHAYMEGAFRFMEHGKALSLLDAIKNTEAEVLSDIDPSVLSTIDSLRERIAVYEIKLISQPEDEIELKEKIVADQSRLNKIITQLEKNNDAYRAIKYDQLDMQIKDLKDCCIESDQSVIEYYIADSVYYILMITEDGDDLIKMDLDVAFVKHVSSIISNINRSASISGLSQAARDQAFTQYLESAKLLYQYLIEPVRKKVELTQNIIIIPDQVLGYLPFDALVSSDTSYVSFRYFIQDHNISYAYSAHLLQMSENMDKRSAVSRILAIAPSFAENNPLASLVFNQEEVISIGENFPVVSLVGEEATKSSFRELANDYSVIHISSHAVVNDSISDLSYICFSQHSNQLDEAEILYINELYQYDLNADLVVLSACKTNLGQLEAGEGIMSLSRAFTYAGASSIVSSLWNIDDEFMSVFIKEFYGFIDAGDEIDASLWKSKKLFLDDPVYSHPYYWASMIPIGNMKSLQLESPELTSTIIGTGGGILLFFLLIFLIKNKSRTKS